MNKYDVIALAIIAITIGVSFQQSTETLAYTAGLIGAMTAAWLKAKRER